MSKILVNMLLLLCLTLPLSAQETNEGIQFFHGTWEEALQKAKKENKLIFVDCYTVWCGPCAAMTKHVFPLKTVGDFYNKHFICMKIDMEKEGKDLAKRYNVVAYPTFLFVTGEGYVAHRGSGRMLEDAFIAFGEKALEIGRGGYEERYAKGERDEAFLKEFLSSLVASHMADYTEKILNELYEEGNTKLLYDKDYWDAFVCCAADIDAPLSQALLKDYKKLCKTHGTFAVDQKVRNLYASIAQVLKLYDEKDRKRVLNEERKRDYLQLMAERDIPYGESLRQEVEFICLLWGKKYEEAYELGEKALAKADARILCNWATLGERMVRKNADVRKKMAAWADRAIKLGVDESMTEEAESVLNDLRTRDMPGYAKGTSRKSIPIRGYLVK